MKSQPSPLSQGVILFSTCKDVNRHRHSFIQYRSRSRWCDKVYRVLWRHNFRGCTLPYVFPIILHKYYVASSEPLLLTKVFVRSNAKTMIGMTQAELIDNVAMEVGGLCGWGEWRCHIFVGHSKVGWRCNMASTNFSWVQQTAVVWEPALNPWTSVIWLHHIPPPRQICDASIAYCIAPKWRYQSVQINAFDKKTQKVHNCGVTSFVCLWRGGKGGGRDNSVTFLLWKRYNCAPITPALSSPDCKLLSLKAYEPNPPFLRQMPPAKRG